MWTRAGFVIVLCIGVAAQAPKAANGRWVASSKTAYSITGDVVLESTGITMLGKRYALTFVRTGQDATVRLFRTRIAKTVKLVNGNDLCGKEDATWLRVAEQGDDLELTFFSGVSEPRLDEDGPALCGTFYYARPAK